jgi:hypothetical protein
MSLLRRLHNAFRYRVPESAIGSVSPLDPQTSRGLAFSRSWIPPASAGPPPPTRLESYFDAHQSGPGLWKWRHYFEIYERHFNRFVGRDVHVLEIGVYSGGSIQMWRDYFGPGCRFTGVDIEPAVQAYASPEVRVIVGDQGDPAFWRSALPTLPRIDVVIDDGGHESHQQITTLEALLPHMNPGGVFFCEDISGGETNPMTPYVSGLVAALQAYQPAPHRHAPTYAVPTPFQAAVHGIHCYPFVTVVELRDRPLNELVAPRHGTEWQPFYDGVLNAAK